MPCRGSLGAEAGTDIMHTCSCLLALLHVAITALLLCRACDGSGRGYVRQVYWEQPLFRTGSFPRSQAPVTQSTPQAGPTLPGRRENSAYKKCFFHPWFCFCLILECNQGFIGGKCSPVKASLQTWRTVAWEWTRSTRCAVAVFGKGVRKPNAHA